MPNLFAIMRGIIDKRRRAGELSSHYLILGSASPELLKQSSESLAGRIAYLELDPFNLREVSAPDGINNYTDSLWLRGGFPDSFLSASDESSMFWRNNFVTTYLERDLPQLNPRLSPEKINTMWKMLAFDQGSVLNASRLSLGLGISVGTVKNYLEVLSGLFLIRFLKPWSGNSTKRLVKSPKVYVRDSGLLHALAKLGTMDDLVGHSLCGLSWEGFVIEQLLQAPTKCSAATFYRSQAGAEIDLVVEIPGKGTTAIEIKRTVTPQISKGFRLGCEDINPARRFYVIPRGSAFPLDKDTQAIGLKELLAVL
jgi:predicted AAA+ superfamily ATPase